MKRSSADSVKTDLKPTPYVALKALPAGVTELKFVGLYVGKKSHETDYGSQTIYEMKLKETNAPMLIKDEVVNVDAGEIVSIFAPGTLTKHMDSLSPAVGELVTILYRGKKKGKKFAWHDYTVEVGE